MDPRTLVTLRDLSRVRLDDVALSRPRWSDDTIDRAINEAEREACVRARLLYDEGTDAVTALAVLADTALYSLHSSIFEVVRVYDETTGAELHAASEPELYRQDARWRTRTASAACEYVISSLPNERLQLRLVPKPLVAASLRLQVYRYPRYEMDSDESEPEIAPRHHENLIDWVCYRCFSVRDMDNYDPVKANDHLAAFTDTFGERPSADVQRRLREPRHHVAKARDF